jgi:hypothetical protein
MKNRILSDSIPEPTTGCWLWLRSRDKDGYGSLRADGRTRRAHREAYMAYMGPIPDGAHVLHKCDTPACVNPDHLFLGTQRDNLRDCVVKGRHGNLVKTHCPQGHPYAGNNLYICPTRGIRQCRLCRNERFKKHRESLKRQPDYAIRVALRKEYDRKRYESLRRAREEL